MCILQLQNVYRRRVEVVRPRLNLSVILCKHLQIVFFFVFETNAWLTSVHKANDAFILSALIHIHGILKSPAYPKQI